MSNVNIKEVEGGEVTTLGDNDGVEIDTGTGSGWIKVTNLVTEILKRITGLTEDTSPSISADFLALYKTSATAARKVTPQTIWNLLTSLTAKTTLADADQVSIADSAASNAAKKITWANVMAAILAYTGTLTNKRITRRKSTEASNATPSINSDAVDCHQITALAAAITSVTITGTPTDGQKLRIEITDNGTARAFAGGASLVSGPATLPTTTVLSKRLYIELEWNDTVSKWVCMATGSLQ